jgi:uncharacterized protein (DUF1684 family)
MRVRSFVFLFAASLGIAEAMRPLSAHDSADVYDVQATESWRATRAKDLQSPTGWLTVSGLFFLKPGANVVGSDPASDVALPPGGAPARVGIVTREPDKVWFEPAAGADVKINNALISSKVELARANRLTTGRVTFFLHESGDRLAIRVRDPESSLLKTFSGLNWFPVREAWRITGKFVPYDTPKPVVVQNVLGDLERFVSPGEVTFNVNGAAVKLQPVRSGQRLWFIFADATAGRETYRIRFLYADAPAADGTVVLDFNRAYNPPCAYNPYTTCPRPPAENFLKVRIEAGERLYALAKK